MYRCCTLLFVFTAVLHGETLPVRVTWGQGAHTAQPVTVSADGGMRIQELAQTGAVDGAAGGLRFVLDYPARTGPKLQKLQVIWADLLAAADADTARRLGEDAAMEPHAPRLYVQTRADGTGGFAVTIEQLKRERAIWIPALDVYVTAGIPFVPLSEHRKSLQAWQGQRLLERIEKEPEATYDEYASRWEDMGSPTYVNPQQTGNGHIIGLAWDSSIHKFGVDRGGGVRNDFGNPDRFRFWFEIGDIAKGIASTWKRQGLRDGLPVVTTVFEREGIHYELEQFAYPLNGPPAERLGSMPMVLLQRLRVSSLDGRPHRVPVTTSHRRAMPSGLSSEYFVDRQGARTVVVNRSFGQTLLEIDGGDSLAAWSGVDDYDNQKMKRVNLTFALDVPAQGTRDLTVKLPSPMLDEAGAAVLARLDYDQALRQTVDFWNAWLAKGAQFEVPEKVVNDLFRASLWHALRLPRRHDGRIDLPYSNFAYDQTGTPWPVNQAVYIDYMLFGLRGYGAVAAEEIDAQYRNNQEQNGHVSGYANWLVYTPGMLYATAQNYLLSHNRAELDRVMPESLKALAWCLEQVKSAERRDGLGKGLVSGPLNDLTGEGLWAFNQAYMYAGLELFGRVLEDIGDPRGREARAVAAQLAKAVDHAFRTASARSPLVELRDHTWIPYVPCEVNTHGRMMTDWYPTDVDTGPLHMLRLKAIQPGSDLGDWLLNDHEDNLFFRGWGIANEPVYNQSGTAYLWRDDPKAVIRTFYSYMASAFSHSALEPVEHRFTHGQYFGPPSTDGAWFELYRHMLILERDDNTLLLAGFTPRRWLEPGQRVRVERAPTRYGVLSMTVQNQGGVLTADVDLEGRARPAAVLVRFRHPQGAPMKSVTVNGRAWTDFDAAREWVRLPAGEKSCRIAVQY